VLSGPIVLVLGWAIARMEEGGTEKASGGRFVRVTRKTDEDEGRARLGRGAKHVQMPGVAMQRVSVPLGRSIFLHDSRHFVPGYDHAVPPGQDTFSQLRL
jgi:hypothetical protein